MSLYLAHSGGDFCQAIRRIVDFFRSRLELERGVLLKPNIVFPVRGSSGEITRPSLVQALIKVLREIKPDVEILIGEGTAAGTVVEENFHISGFRKLASKYGIELVDLHKSKKRRLSWKYGTIELPELAFEKTYINLPILKKSSAALFSGAIKNQKGLLPAPVKKQFHRLGLHGPLAELARIIQPSLTIMDGVNAFKGDLLIGGDDIVEMDRYIVRRLGLAEPRFLAELRSNLRSAGDPPVVRGDADTPVQKVDWKEEEYQTLFNLRLWSNPRACSMCRLRFHELKGLKRRRFLDVMRIYFKLIKLSLVGADIVFGSDPFFRDRGKPLICMGECTKILAEKEGCRHIPGCPPSLRQIAKNI
ncbi:MAG: DUF362 domain-containing protein [Candidatus Aminicenantales bacterium]